MDIGLNYINVILLSICAIVFFTYFIAKKKTRSWKSVAILLVFICIFVYYMLDFKVFLNGGVEKQINLLGLKQGGSRLPIVNVITDRNEEYWGSMRLYRSGFIYGSDYIIYYLPKTNSILKVSNIRETGKDIIYSYRDDYWVSVIIVLIPSLIMIFNELSFKKKK